MADAPLVAVLMGSKNDSPKLEKTFATLTELGIPYTAHVMSAHRTPDRVVELVSNAEENGYKVMICAAGMAAHLAGVVAAHTVLPVIGIPVIGGALNGMDALLSTVQMPGGIPVATVAIGSGGAMNAALLAAQIIATGDAELTAKLKEHRVKQGENVAAGDAALQEELGA